jgi:hypothetical protein
MSIIVTADSRRAQAAGARRADQHLMDNYGRYLKPMRGLWHAKAAGSRCVTNEHWGKPNGDDPFSLWRLNTELLGRKAVSAGWKAKKLPPFRETLELTDKIVLPAAVADGFRIYCGHDSLDKWVDSIKSFDELDLVTRRVFKELFSRKRVAALRSQADETRDRTLEAVILFNADAIILRVMLRAVKRGEIGRVLDVLSHWMLSFRGTKSMPKYGDAVFQMLADLKRMDEKLR